MERYEDIKELFSAVDRNLAELEDSYQLARFDERQATALRSLVKSIASDLRSVLDYSAHTIYETYSTKYFSGYFPFGQDEASFVKNVKGNLNGLETQRPDLYVIVESIQPHKANSCWLETLCKIAAATKHRELVKQRRVNSGTVKTSIGGFLVVGGASVTIDGGAYNGLVIERGSPFTISNERPLVEIEADYGIPIKGFREFDKVTFELVGFDVDALTLLSTARKEIGVFVENLKSAIDGSIG